MNTKMLWLAGALLGFSVQQAAALLPCHNGELSGDDGLYISIGGSFTYKIFGASPGLTGSWLPDDKVIICPKGGNVYKITNTSRRNQTVTAFGPG